jgi:hypothetical protein
MITINQDRVFVGGRVIGQIWGYTFVQKVTRRHLFRELNSKGIEFDVYQRLVLEGVNIWRIVFKDTGQIFEIPLAKICKVGILRPPHSAGNQYHVRLQDFTEVRPILQKEMF